VQLALKSSPLYYAPAENLERIDVALIQYRKARNRYGRICLDGLAVMVRIYLDGTQLAEREPVKVFNYLAETPTVEIRTKRDQGGPMHLKSYQIDGRWITRRDKDGEPLRSIGRSYNVSAATISRLEP
jgi:hypothetical protein